MVSCCPNLFIYFFKVNIIHYKINNTLTLFPSHTNYTSFIYICINGYDNGTEPIKREVLNKSCVTHTYQACHTHVIRTSRTSVICCTYASYVCVFVCTYVSGPPHLYGCILGPSKARKF